MIKNIEDIDAYLNGDLSEERMISFEKELAEDEDFHFQVQSRKMELKAYGRLEEYMNEEEQKTLAHKTWLASLYSTAMLIGSYYTQAKSFEPKDGRAKSDKKTKETPGAGS